VQNSTDGELSGQFVRWEWCRKGAIITPSSIGPRVLMRQQEKKKQEGEGGGLPQRRWAGAKGVTTAPAAVIGCCGLNAAAPYCGFLGVLLRVEGTRMRIGAAVPGCVEQSSGRASPGLVLVGVACKREED